MLAHPHTTMGRPKATDSRQVFPLMQIRCLVAMYLRDGAVKMPKMGNETKQLNTGLSRNGRRCFRPRQEKHQMVRVHSHHSLYWASLYQTLLLSRGSLFAVENIPQPLSSGVQDAACCAYQVTTPHSWAPLFTRPHFLYLCVLRNNLSFIHDV